MSRYIDADNLCKAKYHNLPYTHIVPSNENAESYERGWNDAIDAIIENEPTADVVEVTSETYDCVSRQQVRDLLHEYMNTEDFTLGHLDDCICELPTVDVQPVVKGEWIDEEYDIGECYATCSVCGEISQGKAEDNGFGYDYSFSKHCPNCGARMEAEE